MKCTIILALVAFAGATPLTGLFGEGHHQFRKWGDSWEHQEPHKEAVHSVADKITEEALRDQDDYTREAIKNLQWKLQQHPQRWEGYSHGRDYDVGSTEHEPFVTAEAIRQLQEDLKHHQRHSGDVVHHLHDTIEAGVDAQITAGRHVPGVHGGVFKKLIDEHTEQEIENQISHHHHWAQQLQQQQHFVNKQKHEIETQQLLVQHRGTPEQVQRLKEAHRHLQLQEFHLIHEQLAHHLAVLKLQEALVHKEQQILEDTIGERVHEEATRDDFGRKYWSTRDDFGRKYWSY